MAAWRERSIARRLYGSAHTRRNDGNQRAALQAARRAVYKRRHFPVIIKTLIAATLAAALLSSAGAQGRRDMSGAAVPPPVVSQTIAAQRGEKIPVPLSIHGTRGELLEFLIRTPPAHGKLSALKNAALNTATVIYTPSARSSAAEDRFSYSVRGSEGVSAPGVIVLRFSEPVVVPPKLATPNEIDFPPVFPGQRSTAELEITNEGGGFLEGEVSVEEPWSIEGVKIFKIAAKSGAVIRLVFSPTQPGVRTGEAIIRGAQRKVVALRASAEQRLEATPALLKLTAPPGKQTRMGELKITNRSDEDVTVSMEAGERLLMDHSVRIPGRHTSTVPVFADAAEGAAFDEVVKLTCKEWSASVKVHTVAVGAILKFATDELSMKGNAGDEAATGTAILENSGGEPVTVRLDVERPFDIATRVVTAPARGRVEIPVVVRSVDAGTFQSALKAIGEGGSAIVQVKAEIAEPPQIRADIRTTPAAPEKIPDSVTAENPRKDDDALLLPTDARDIPNMLGKFARSTGPDAAVIEWPASLGPVENAHVEERVLSLSGGNELEIGWSPLAHVAITAAGGQMTATLSGIKPGTIHTVRVVSGKGTDAAVLFTVEFTTAPKKAFFTFARMRTPLLGIALCALLFAVWRARRAAPK